MRNSLGRSVLTILMSVLSCGIVYGDVNFSSRDSGFFILDGGRMHVESPNFTVQGALGLSGSAELSGENIHFASGTLNRENAQASFSGQYSMADNGKIILGGKNSLYVQPGSVLAGVSVEGKGNIIEGAPLLADSITLKDANSELFLGLHNKLTQDLHLNGGTLHLTNDLSLGDNVKIVGPGTIRMNNRRLYIGGFAKSTWSTDLNFYDGADIVLNNDLAVQGTWRFQGFSTINGNGNLLDVSSGSLTCADHRNSGVLTLIDVAVQGIGQKSIVMTKAGHEIRCNRSFLQFDSDVNFTAGKLMIEGPSSFILGSSGVTFRDAAILNVESQLILDVRSHEGVRSGSLDAGGNIFSGGKINASAVGSALTSGRLVLKNGGLIDNAGVASRSNLGRLGMSHSKVALGAPGSAKVAGSKPGKVVNNVLGKLTVQRPQAQVAGSSATDPVQQGINDIIAAEGSGDDESASPRVAPREDADVVSVEGAAEAQLENVTALVESADVAVEPAKASTSTNPFNVVYASEAEAHDVITSDEIGALPGAVFPVGKVDRVSLVPVELQSAANNGIGTTQADGDVVPLIKAGRVFVMYDAPIAISANISIDGQGATLEFVGAATDYYDSNDNEKLVANSQDNALFSVADGQTVHLKNVTLSNITPSTFKLGVGSTVVFDENVTLEFGDDVLFSAGAFQATQQVRLRGMNGRKKVEFLPADANPMFDIQANPLVVQDVELIGVQYISSQAMGSIVLAGNATAQVDASTAMNFDVVGTDNKLVLTQDSLVFSGNVRFSARANVNELGIRFALTSPLKFDRVIPVVDAQGTVTMVPVQNGNPLVIFNADQGMLLAAGSNDATDQTTLSATTAGLIFEDPSVSVVNGFGANATGFVIGDSSYLIAKNLEILGHAIHQEGHFTSHASSISGSGIDQSQSRAHRPGYKAHHREIVTTFEKLTQQKIQARPVQQKKVASRPQGARRVVKKGKDGRRVLHRGMDFLDDEDDIELRSPRGGMDGASTYAVREYQSTTVAVGPESVPALYEGATRRNFSTSAKPFNITLKDQATLEQNPATAIAFGSGQTVHVIGKKNRIVVTNDCAVDGAGLVFDENSTLTFEFDKQSSKESVLTISGAVNLPAGAGIVFKGQGRVVLADGSSFALKGKADCQAFVSVCQGARVENAAGAHTAVTGIGAVLVSGGIVALNRGTCSLGGSLGNDIQFSVTDGGIVDLSGGAYMRFVGGGSCSFDVSRRGALTIDTDSTLAFNEGVNGMLQRGLLKALSFSYATIIARGTMKFGPNILDDKYFEQKTSVTIENSSIGGAGSVAVVTQANLTAPGATQTFALAARQPADAAIKAQSISIGTIRQYLS